MELNGLLLQLYKEGARLEFLVIPPPLQHFRYSIIHTIPWFSNQTSQSVPT